MATTNLAGEIAFVHVPHGHSAAQEEWRIGGEKWRMTDEEMRILRKLCATIEEWRIKDEVMRTLRKLLATREELLNESLATNEELPNDFGEATEEYVNVRLQHVAPVFKLHEASKEMGVSSAAPRKSIIHRVEAGLPQTSTWTCEGNLPAYLRIGCHAIKMYKGVSTAAAQAMDDEAMPESVSRVKLSKLNDDEPARESIRRRDWIPDEILAMLEFMEERAKQDVVLDWDYVSGSLCEHYDFDRASSSWENLWGTLLRSYRAFQDHESQNRASTEFDLKCRQKIDRILTAKPILGTRYIRMDGGLPLCPQLHQHQSSHSDTGHFGALDDELTDSETDTQSEDEEFIGESQVEVTADSHVPRAEQSHDYYYQTNSKYAGRKRRAAWSADEYLPAAPAVAPAAPAVAPAAPAVVPAAPAVVPAGCAPAPACGLICAPPEVALIPAPPGVAPAIQQSQQRQPR